MGLLVRKEEFLKHLSLQRKKIYRSLRLRYIFLRSPNRLLQNQSKMAKCYLLGASIHYLSQVQKVLHHVYNLHAVQ